MSFFKNKFCSVSPFKQMESEIKMLSGRAMAISAGIVLAAGFISRLWTGWVRYPIDAYVPIFLPPLFIMTLLQIFWCIVSGAIIGASVAHSSRACRDYRNRGILYMILHCVFAFTWYPLFFGVYAHFAATLAAALMCIFCFFAMINLVRVYYIFGVTLLIYLISLLCFFIGNISYLLIN
jgi:hypothetical protein